MNTSYIFVGLEPTEPLLTVYLSETQMVNYNSENEFIQKANSLVQKLKDSVGNPKNYQEKISDRYESKDICEEERLRKIDEYKLNGYPIKVIHF